LTTRSPAHFKGETKFNNFIGHRGSNHSYRKDPPGEGDSLVLKGPGGGLES